MLDYYLNPTIILCSLPVIVVLTLILLTVYRNAPNFFSEYKRELLLPLCVGGFAYFIGGVVNQFPLEVDIPFTFFVYSILASILSIVSSKGARVYMCIVNLCFVTLSFIVYVSSMLAGAGYL